MKRKDWNEVQPIKKGKMGEIFLMSGQRWSSDANGLEESEKIPQSHLYSLLLIELDSTKIKLVDRSNRIRKVTI